MPWKPRDIWHHEPNFAGYWNRTLYNLKNRDCSEKFGTNGTPVTPDSLLGHDRLHSCDTAFPSDKVLGFIDCLVSSAAGVVVCAVTYYHTISVPYTGLQFSVCLMLFLKRAVTEYVTLNCVSRKCENSTKTTHSKAACEVVAWTMSVQDKHTVTCFGVSCVTPPCGTRRKVMLLSI